MYAMSVSLQSLKAVLLRVAPSRLLPLTPSKAVLSSVSLPHRFPLRAQGLHHPCPSQLLLRHHRGKQRHAHMWSSFQSLAYGGSVACAVSPAGAPGQTYQVILVKCVVCFPRAVEKNFIFQEKRCVSKKLPFSRKRKRSRCTRCSTTAATATRSSSALQRERRARTLRHGRQRPAWRNASLRFDHRPAPRLTPVLRASIRS